MSDVFAGLLPYLPGVPFGLLAVVLYRLWNAAVKELRVERKDHSRTHDELDAERESRRLIEDKAERDRRALEEKVDELTRQVRGLRAEVGRLRAELGEAGEAA